MGTVFGKESVKEPPFELQLKRNDVKTSYELRKYGERYAASVEYSANGDTSSPFRTLARYIGVFGTPENEGSTSIAMVSCWDIVATINNVHIFVAICNIDVTDTVSSAMCTDTVLSYANIKPY